MQYELRDYLEGELPITVMFPFPQSHNPLQQMLVHPRQGFEVIIPTLSYAIETFLLERGYTKDMKFNEDRGTARQNIFRGKLWSIKSPFRLGRDLRITIEEAEQNMHEIFFSELKRGTKNPGPPLQTKRRETERNTQKVDLKTWWPLK